MLASGFDLTTITLQLSGLRLAADKNRNSSQMSLKATLSVTRKNMLAEVNEANENNLQCWSINGHISPQTEHEEHDQ